MLLFAAAVGSASAQGDAARGAYLAAAGGCAACHTAGEKDAVPFAGGRALQTPFGTFYGPNITPHPGAGIGLWTEGEFVRAMRLGLRPDGAHYYPAFPYPSYTKISDADLRDLWAFLRALAPSGQPNRPHDLAFPLRLRWLVGAWNWLYFTPGAYAADAGLPPPARRGAYLAQALGHCGECHTPRNFLGGPKRHRFLAGGKGPDGKRVPNLTPTRLAKWSDEELKDYLATGITPDGDVAADKMREVTRNTGGKLTPADLAALVAYLRSLPPVADEPTR